MEFNIVIWFYFGVNCAASGHGEPEFNLVRDGRSSLVGINAGLHIDSTPVAFGVDLQCEELVVYEVISKERVRLLWEVSPGFNFDALGFRHLDLN
jgi:hypothetical protein